MPDSRTIHDEFLEKITAIIMKNISDERFGVSELAREIGMSRSNLLRTVKKKTGISVSQFLRQVRLKEAMEILMQSGVTVSEVSYDVGFSSTSYFIKCFREYYGYPPGEVGKSVHSDSNVVNGSGSIDTNPDDSGQIINPNQQGADATGLKKRNRYILITAFAATLLVILFLKYLRSNATEREYIEKSIAVLPFINDSDDSTNVYIINGLMESILNSLQHIEDLRVISRTSVEKYRDNFRTIPEMARELNVNYFVEGSGQKIGDQIILHVQLIEAPGDKHLLSEQYRKEATDIFSLQTEVAKDIADKIQAVITQEEEKRISTPPTDDVLAYDYFLKGRDLIKRGYTGLLEEAKVNLDKAIEQDPDFARAYAAAALTCYFLDESHPVKEYTIQINRYADQALRVDAQLPQALLAKALFYMNDGQYDQAVPYFEEALQFNPNYDLAFAFLAELYVNYIPDTKKYLEYGLKGIQLDISSYDSLERSMIYLHVANAFIQSGFADEAETYIERSLAYDPDNLYAAYVRPYILYARDGDLQRTRDLLMQTLDRAPTMLDLLIETGKLCYFMRDYESAFSYFKRFMAIHDSLGLQTFTGEYAKIGYVLEATGHSEESDQYFADYLEYAENDRSIYRHLSLAVYNVHEGNTQKAIEELELFAQQDNYHYWTILFTEIDPLMDPIKDLPDFRRIFGQIETKFWNYHEEIRVSLEEKGLI